MSTAKPTATAVVKFMDDRSVQVKLTSCAGITARQIDSVTKVLFIELQKLRAAERLKDAQKQALESKTKEVNTNA